jgi:hypothetical protein
MPNITRGLELLDSLVVGGEHALSQRLLLDLLDGNRNVRFTSVKQLHECLSRDYGFALRRNTTQGVRPGGRHLFYVLGNLLVRVKTSGTAIRPNPHLTLSLASGLDWNQEDAKVNQAGAVVPKLGASRAGSDWRALARIGDMAAIEASDQRWADTCHFNFAAGFDDTAAAALPVQA